jgi:hypothetical protein
MPGFPIRTPSDLSSVGSSPRLIAASYVLHRLLMPRHPPCALKNLTTKMLASTVQFSNNHQNTRAATANTYQPKSWRFVANLALCLLPKRRTTRSTRPCVLSGPNSMPNTTQATRPDPFHAPKSRTRHPVALPISSAFASSSTSYRATIIDTFDRSDGPPQHIRRHARQMLLRKEVIQPHLPVRLPCYDFVPIASPTFDRSPPCGLGHGLRVLPTFVT